MLLLPLLVATALATDTPVDVLDPSLRERFIAAEASWESGRLAEAATGFTAITEAAPDFDRAHRRLCGVLLQQGLSTEAVSACARAVELKASVPNRTGLAIALIRAEADPAEAVALIDAVTAEDPDYLPGWEALCTHAMAVDDAARLRQCVDALAVRAPQSDAVPVFRALVAAHDARFDEAQNHLAFASQAGVDAETIATVRARIGARMSAAQARAPVVRTPQWTAMDLVPAGIVLLLIAGIAVLALSARKDGGPDTPG